MKKIYTLLSGIALCTTLSVQAAGGPDAYGYTWITSLDPGGPTYNWIDITARPGVQTVTGLADDNSAAGMINIGFPFHYYWSDYTQLKVGSNGWCSFNNVSNIASCFPTIPTAGNGDNILCPLMGDLNFTTSGPANPGEVKYWTNSVDTFIISYINVPFWTVNFPGWAGSNSFQVILCSSDSSITYQYGALGGFAGNAACIDLTVGIENSTGGIGLEVHSDALPPTNYVIRFEYPVTVLLAIQDVLPLWNNNSGNAAQFIFNNMAFPVSTDVKNAGNTAMASSIMLQTSIADAVFTNVYTGTGSLPTLAAGDDSLYTYTNTWTPAAVGQYSCQTAATSTSDINTANDVLTTELDVVNPCANNMVMSYVSGTAPSNSVNWNGGANDDGAAVYFAPPVYPYTVASLQYYITSNVGNDFIAQIYDDNGPNGGPGTQLFTTTVPSASITSAAWNTVTVSSPVTLTSGGFYVVWLQGGTSIFLGCETSGPRSHLNYEILDNAWATFRYDETQDLCIRAAINGYTSVPTAAMSSSTNLLDLTVTNTTTGLATSYMWDFGDATTSTLASPPTHTYAAPGTYNVCLIATSPCGADTVCTSVTVCSALSAAYSQSTAALTANFTDMTGTAVSWLWDFGDSNVSTAQNPVHTYAMGGTYNVCLIVTDACGAADTVCQQVSVCAPNTASFMNTASGLSTNFMDMSSGAIDTWTWDFGDMTGTSTTQSPSYTYAAPGTYNVCLIVANSCGNSDTICQTVTVCNIGVAGFTYTTDEDSIMVTDASTGGIMNWFWDYGDGNTDTVQNPGTHHYATTGIYTLCLITTDSCGLMDTLCVQDTILITGYNVNQAGINSIYPNPAAAEITVELWWNVASDIEIFDATGKLVYRQNEVSGSVIRIDINDLTPGLYTLRVTNKGGMTSRRFVKE